LFTRARTDPSSVHRWSRPAVVSSRLQTPSRRTFTAADTEPSYVHRWPGQRPRMGCGGASAYPTSPTRNADVEKLMLLS
jgi:hypothetical protein